MTARINGTEFTRRYISENLLQEHKRVKVVVVDLDINPNHPAIQGRFDFLDPDHEARIRSRKNDDSRFIEALHGASCMAILKRNGQLSQHEQLYWDLAPFADIYFFPLLDPAEFPEALLAGYSDDVVAAFLDARRLTDTLDAIINDDSDRRLSQGDIVAITIGLDDGISLTSNSGWGTFPVYHLPSVEERIREITCEMGVSVIVSAGNRGINLDDAHAMSFNTLETPHRRKYSNSGSECGAILVGAKDGNRSWARSNSGNAIDAYGPGSIQSSDGTSRQESNIRSLDGQIFAFSLSVAWGDTSSSAVYVAAILANVQQVRIIEGFDPLPPFGARAHLRQWRAKEFGHMYRDLPTPDALAWLVGTGVLQITDDEYDEFFGSEIFIETEKDAKTA
ncbi:S8 family serine peptidase [Sulfitobacter mediterraneus]|uniref:S8 family serine peptidase n=1 Tax=Sulfitobacter mediterraneus TaxID=83219 RepID=UPI0021A39275|nr:S8 family serine peptidase [Sulfitobacter mediterraneus]UWR10960.1 S8 family serine peptidase [Sulfitobacter mediterraneus]